MKRESLVSAMKELCKKPLPLVLALLGVLLLVFGGGLAERKESRVTEESESGAYRAMLERELESLLGKVRGVGKVEVMVTLESGERRTYSGSKLLGSEMPRVLGVAVVCSGGGRSEVESEVRALLSSLLGIGSHRIHVSEKRA